MKRKLIVFLTMLMLVCCVIAGTAFSAVASETVPTNVLGKNKAEWTALSQDNVSIENDIISVKKYASLKTPLNTDYIKIVFNTTANADTIDNEWRDFVMVISDETDLDPINEFSNRGTGKLNRNSLIITVGARDNQWNVCIGGNVLERPGDANYAYTWWNITGNDGDAYALSDYTKPIVFEMNLTVENPTIRVSQEGSRFSGYTYTPTNSLVYFVRQWWTQNAMGEAFLTVANYEASDDQALEIASIETSAINYGANLGVSSGEEWTDNSKVTISDDVVTATGDVGLKTPVYVDETTFTIGALDGTSASEYSMILAPTQATTIDALTSGLAITLGVSDGNWKASADLYANTLTNVFNEVLSGFDSSLPLTVRYELIGENPVIEFYSAGARKSYPVAGFDRSLVAGSDLKSYLSVDYVGSSTAYGVSLSGIRTITAASADAVGAKASEWSLSNEFTARQYADGVGVMAQANTLATPLCAEYIKVTFELTSIPEMAWFNINFSAVDGYMAEGTAMTNEAANGVKVPTNPVLGVAFDVASTITHMTTKMFYTSGSAQEDTVHQLSTGLKFASPTGHQLPIITSEKFSITISMSETDPYILIEQGRNDFMLSSFNCPDIANGLLSKSTYSNSEGQTFLSIGSYTTDLEIKVTDIETSNTAPGMAPPEDVDINVTATVPKSSPVNEEFTVPTAKVVMVGGSESKTTVLVTDPDGVEVEVVDGKFTPTKEGTYKIIYTAVDNWGTTDTAEYKLKITNATPPTLVIESSTVPTTGIVGEKLMLPTATITDDSDPAPYELIVVKDPAGREVIVINGGFTPDRQGVYTVQYTASDSDGNIAKSDVFKITVSEPAKKGGCKSFINTTSIIMATLIVLSATFVLISKKRV